MACVATNLAFIFPGGQEMILILIVGIMLFGRRLPEVGRAVAKTVTQLRQGLNKIKEEMDLDEEVAELRHSVREVRDTVTNSVEAPRRAIKDPGRALMNLTNESLSAPSLSEIQDDLKSSLLESEPAVDAVNAPDSAETPTTSSVESTSGRPASGQAPDQV